MRWLHPLKIFVMGAVMVVGTMLLMEFGVTLVSASHVMNLGYANPNITLYCKDWAGLIAATVWICLFSIAVMGALINLVNGLRVNSSKVKRFDALKSLTKDEAEDLHEWLDTQTYDLSYLKEMWGQHHDS